MLYGCSTVRRLEHPEIDKPGAAVKFGEHRRDLPREIVPRGRKDGFEDNNAGDLTRLASILERMGDNAVITYHLGRLRRFPAQRDGVAVVPDVQDLERDG